jgi:hypothetical protein
MTGDATYVPNFKSSRLVGNFGTASVKLAALYNATPGSEKKREREREREEG